MRYRTLAPRILNPAYNELRAMIHKRAIDAFENARVCRAHRHVNRYQQTIYQITVFAASNASTALCSLIEGTDASYDRVKVIITGWRDVAQRDIDYYLKENRTQPAVYFQLEKAHCVRMLRLLRQIR